MHASVDVLTVTSAASAREMVREWEHIKSLCGLLFHPIMSVRRQAALCVCHVALAPERVKASAYRKVMGFRGHTPRSARAWTRDAPCYIVARFLSLCVIVMLAFNFERAAW